MRDGIGTGPPLGGYGMSIRELLIERRESGYRAGVDDDGHKIGVAVEGGGMRGVVSGAMLIALRELGLFGVIDGFYGTSAGAINVAYSLTAATWRGLAIYYDHLAVGPFIRFRRLARGGPAVDIDLLVELMDGTVTLDYRRVLAEARRIRFGVGLSNIDENGPTYQYDFDSVDDLRSALRASAWLPFLTGPPQLHRGQRFVDGALYVPTPLYVALDDDCSHVLRLICRTEGPGPAKPGPAERVIARRLERWHEGAGAAFVDRRAAYLVDRAALGSTESVLRGTVVHPLACPPGAHRVGSFTTDRQAVLDGARAGYDHVLRQFGAEGASHFRVEHA